MKILARALALILLLQFLAFPAPAEDHRRLTLMVYMCGSNLESGYGSASADIQEMLASGFDAHQVTVLVMAGGTAEWNLAFDPAQTSVTEITPRGMRIVWRSDALNMGEPETLTRLLAFGQENYPADDYALILWDHGGGPLEGVCWDELFSMDNLSLNELTGAIEAASLPKKLSFIGFDACLMSSVEVASALSPYADYMIASQETEPAKGWNYAFLADIADDLSAAETGRRIVDGYFEALADSNDILTMACVDLAKVAAVAERMDDYFTPMADNLDSAAFARLSGMRLSSTGFGKSVRGVGEEGYDLVDLVDLVSRLGGENAELEAALSEAVVYSRSSESGAGGLSVYHPFANKRKYAEAWADNYRALNFCPGYSEYMNRFGALLTGDEMTDWSGLVTNDEGFGANDENLFSLQLTSEQLEGFASAQLMVLASFANNYRRFPALAPLSIENVEISETGLLTARYSGRALYIVDEEGQPLAGPISYALLEDGETYAIVVQYYDYSGRYNSLADAFVLYHCQLDEATGNLEIVRTYVYDKVSDTYTNRIPFSEEGYTIAGFTWLLRQMPTDSDPMPGFENWDFYDGYAQETLMLPCEWRLRFFDERLSGDERYAVFRITDVQQTAYSSRPVPITSPGDEGLRLAPETAESDGLSVGISAAANRSQADPHVRLKLILTNATGASENFSASTVVINGSRAASDTFHFGGEIEDGDSVTATLDLNALDMMEIERLETVDFTIAPAYAASDSEDGTLAVHIEFDDADVTWLAAAPEALAEGSADGVSCRLLSLEREPSGTLYGNLYVVNDTDVALNRFDIVIDGVRSVENSFSYAIAPHSSAVLRFSLDDQCPLSLWYLTISGNTSLYLANLDQIYEQNGVSEIGRMEVLINYSSLTASDTFTVPMDFAAPIEMPEARGLAEIDTPPHAELMTGGISMEIESALIADDGLALGVWYRNDTDEWAQLDAVEPSLEGWPDVDAFALTADSALLPPHSVTAGWLVLYVDNDGGELSRLSFEVKSRNVAYGPIEIAFPEGTAFGTPGGTLINADALSITPCAYGTVAMALDETVVAEGCEDVAPIELTVPLDEDAMAEARSAYACLGLLDESGAEGAPELRPVAISPLSPDDGWQAHFTGLALMAGERVQMTVEQRLPDGGVNITNRDFVYFFTDAEDFEADPDGLRWIAGTAWHTEIDLTVDAFETGPVVRESKASAGGMTDIDAWMSDYDFPDNLPLSEVALTVIETRAYGVGSRLGPVRYAQAPLTNDDVFHFALRPAASLPGRLCVYFEISYDERASRELIVDLNTGETLMDSDAADITF